MSERDRSYVMAMARSLCLFPWLPLALTSAILALLCTNSSADRPYACGADFSDLPFCNRELPLEARVADLISRLSLQEKIGQLVSSTSNVSRLGIPSYFWWSEALHGLSDNGPGIWFGNDIPSVTTFPQVILSAASFNRTLWNLIAQVVSTEARAMHNVGQAGLTFWSPNINIFRDPRWGRGQETPGEDPLLSSEYAVAYVSGLQGKEYEEGVKQTAQYKNGLKVSACCKHFTAYDLENWGAYTRYTFDAVVSPQDFADTYHPPFKRCIQDAEATCVMCSYNRVNGIPACADEYLLSQLTRQEWGFKGYITSDCDAVAVVYEYIAYASSPEDAVADCLNAGMDLNCGTYVSRHASAAIEKGTLNVSTIDRALSNLLTIQMRLGLFDGNPKSQVYGTLGPESVCTDDHQKLALEAARQGLVLLKNEDHALPLSTNQVSKLAIIGPNANASAEELLGNYAGPPCKVITPLDAIRKYVDITYQPGCSDVACASDFLIQAAVDSVSTADVVILFAGLDQSQEGEDHDRTDLVLPGQQTNLILRVASAAKGTVVLVVMSGGPVDISFARDCHKIKSIIWAGYPGEAGGQAIAEALFGEYSPGGRLPVTWYPQSFTYVPMTNMHMRPNLSSGYPGRTYRFYKGDSVFEFGHGLSYLNVSEMFTVAPSEVMLPFCADNLKKKIVTVNETPSLCYTSGDDDKLCRNVKVNVVVNVRNNGKIGGSHTVLLFSQSSSTDVSVPQKQLLDFKRITLEPNTSKDVHFTLNPCKHLAVVNEEGKKVLKIDTHTLRLNDMVGHSFLLRASLLL